MKILIVDDEPVARQRIERALLQLSEGHQIRQAGNAKEALAAIGVEVPERWARADPVRAGAPGVPVLVVHPTDDETVPVARSREYAAATGCELVETVGNHRDPIDPSSAAWAAAARWLGPAR